MNTKIIKKDEIAALGQEIAEKAKPGAVIALIGDLGTGKTTLSKAIGRGLKIKELMTSPTFTIVQEYHSGRLPLYHFDVYRVCDPEELFEIGYEEYFYGKGITIVEWADLIEDLLPADTWRIYLDYGEEEDERKYRCTF